MVPPHTVRVLSALGTGHVNEGDADLEWDASCPLVCLLVNKACVKNAPVL